MCNFKVVDCHRYSVGLTLSQSWSLIVLISDFGFIFTLQLPMSSNNRENQSPSNPSSGSNSSGVHTYDTVSLSSCILTQGHPTMEPLLGRLHPPSVKALSRTLRTTSWGWLYGTHRETIFWGCILLFPWFRRVDGFLDGYPLQFGFTS